MNSMADYWSDSETEQGTAVQIAPVPAESETVRLDLLCAAESLGAGAPPARHEQQLARVWEIEPAATLAEPFTCFGCGMHVPYGHGHTAQAAL